MNESILLSIKNALGLSEDYDAFDAEIILFINSVFQTLHQLGIGPDEGFEIEDKESKWNSFVQGKLFNVVKSYMFLRVRMMFDPPATSYLLTSIKEQVNQLEWRMNVLAEGIRMEEERNDILENQGQGAPEFTFWKVGDK